EEVPWQDEPLMEIGLLAAHLAAHAQEPEDVCQRAAWLALVNGARGWIAAGTHGDVADQLLPGSFLLLLDTLHDDQSTGDPVIRLARAMLQRAERALTGDQGEDPEVQKAIIDLADWLPGEQGNQAPVIPLDLAQLARRIARMETMEENFDRQLEEEKLRALKELAQGAGHEINNPLANISILAQTLLRNETDPERRVQLASINSQAFRATEMISDMMLFAKPPRMELQLVNVASLVHRAVDDISDRADQAGVAIRIEAEVGPLFVEADENHLVEAIKAVCVNSLEACRHGGLVEVMIHEQPTGGWGHDRAAVIEIRDDGPGIPVEVRPHIFSPFYSGREAGRGLGFGLSKSWRIVTEHGGRIEVDEPAEGARLMISLPLAEKPAA
ncbi:MAG: HAMP domain-containing sensor histidine kinase, partial [Pirellulaceae bacterium]|nr:HAMP domain-containing sensor histidine kinase [Pirellulaceae bacterium]